MTEIDVSECEGYKDKHCRYETSIMFTEGNLCSKFPNCYYKQMKRLEFENKLLKADYEASEAENARLKEENFKLGQIDIKKVTLVENRQLEEENAKLKEKLEKIKNIVDFNLIFPINNITKREIGEKIKSIIEGAEDDNM